MNVEVVAGELLARHAAERVAARLREVVDDRGAATLAVSGGSTPTAMFAVLATLRVPWPEVTVVQVDERLAPDGDDRRNLTSLRAALLDAIDGPGPRLVSAPAGLELDPDTLAERYAAALDAALGPRPVLDLVLLGLGADGHTASLVPGDPALEVHDRDVAATGTYQGTRRVTLTVPALTRARQRWYLVTGDDKADAVTTLVRGDRRSIPAGRLPDEATVLLLDPAAASGLETRPT